MAIVIAKHGSIFTKMSTGLSDHDLLMRVLPVHTGARLFEFFGILGDDLEKIKEYLGASVRKAIFSMYFTFYFKI